MSESDKTTKKLNSFAMEGNYATITDCSFNIGGNIQMVGEGITIMGCSMTMNGNAPAIDAKS